MKHALSGAVVAAAILVAACSGGGGGSSTTASVPAPHSTSSAVPAAGPVSGTRGTISLVIPASKSAAGAKRHAQFISSSALSAVVTVNGGSAASYDLSTLSPSCTPVPSGRACTVAIGVPVGTGSAAVTLSLWDGAAGTGTMLGSGTGSSTIPNGATSFTIALDVSPVVAGVAFSLSFPSTGLPRISINHVENGVNAGSMVMTFTDPDGVVIPANSTSSFLNPVTLSVTDPSGTVSLSLTNIVNPTQTVSVFYTGAATIGASVTFNAVVGATPVGTLVSKTSGYQTNFSIGLNGAQSKRPVEITVGSDGFLWFAESTNWSIGRMDASVATAGAFTEFLLPNSGSSPSPVSMAAGPPGDAHVWYTDATNGSGGLGDFGNATVPGGATTDYFTGNANSGPYSIRSDGTMMWIGLQNSNALAVVNTLGVAVPMGPGTPAPGTEPGGLALGPDGNMWVAGFGNGTLLAFSTVAPYPIVNTLVVPAGAGSQPAELLAGPDGALWFTEQIAANIGRYPTGGPITEFALPAPYVTPWSIVTGSDGGIWFTASHPGHGDIVRIDPATHAFVEYTLTTTTQTSMGLVAGPDGNLWATDYVGSAVVRIQP